MTWLMERILARGDARQRRLSRTAALLGVALVGMQFVPTSTKPNAGNVSEVHTAAMIDPQAGAILDRSCQDCHSTNTSWPWYSRVAPVSWIVSRDVSRGRVKLDFSQWAGRPHSDNERMEVCDAVSDGSMPLRAYTVLHRSARLSPQDVGLICDWAAARDESVPSLKTSGVNPADILTSSDNVRRSKPKGSQ